MGLARMQDGVTNFEHFLCIVKGLDRAQQVNEQLPGSVGILPSRSGECTHVQGVS